MAKKKSAKAAKQRPSAPIRKRARNQPVTRENAGAQRLNKVLAAAGLGSRREVEELIVQGRVEVDQEVVTDLACKVDPRSVAIKVDGQTLKRPRLVYFALNKPKGVLSTNKDPSGRMRVIDFVPDGQRVFSVGRLDRNSEGLMLLTNDGELAQRLAHPSFRVQKTYFVVVAGTMTSAELAKLRKGVYLAEGVARIDGASIKKHRKGCTEVEIVLSEGKNREIRRILARAGHKVVTLRRIAIGPLRLAQLPLGASRTLTAKEVKALYAFAEASSRAGAVKGRRKSQGKNGPSSGKTAGSKDVSNPVHDLDVDGDQDWDEFDDDFVGDFSGVGSIGSVLGFEDSGSSNTPRPSSPRKTNRRATSQARRSTGKPVKGPGAAANKSAGRAKTKRKSAHKVVAKNTVGKKKSASGRRGTKSPVASGGPKTARKSSRASKRSTTGPAKRSVRPSSRRGKR